MSSAKASASAPAGGCGCTSTIIFFLLVWVLVFGISFGGAHYSIGCSCDDGVVIDETLKEDKGARHHE